MIDVLEIIPPREHDARLVGFSIDRPAVRQSFDDHTFEIAGWAVGRDARVVQIELIHGVNDDTHEDIRFQEIYGSRSVYRAAVALPRHDVIEYFHPTVIEPACGFSFFTSVIGLPPTADLWLMALFADGSRASLGVIRVQHQALRSDFRGRLQPLMLMGLGRSGTTLLMQALSLHPQIVAQRIYPYETRAAAYWLHTLRLMAMPADHRASAHPDMFLHNLWWTGFHPFNIAPYSDGPQVSHWFRQRYPEQLASFFQQMIEQFYLQVAAEQGQVTPRYFAEKYYPDRVNYVPWLTWELYTGAREIFLVRDFRDTVCSMLAFNAKRGQQDFGRAFVRTDEEFVWLIRLEALRLLRLWQSRAGQALLVRYEDFIENPGRSLASICNYLDLPASSAEISNMLPHLSPTNATSQAHRTSSGRADAIGRWQRDLPPDLRSICEYAFDDLLAGFGYQ